MAKGTFNVKSSTINSQYEYKNDAVVVNGSYIENAQTNELQSINGAAYEKNADGSMGKNIGNFNGYVRDGGIKYNFSEMSIADLDKVEAAVAEIEAEVTKEN